MNRSLAFVFGATLLGFLMAAPAALAQQEQHAENLDPENHEMQHRERHAEGPAAEQHREQEGHSTLPLRHTAMKALVLPALSDTLGLSADQERQLEDVRSSFLSKQEARREEVHSQKKALHELMQGNDRPESAAVREQLSALANKRAELKAAPYETAVEMREVLTDEQRDLLDELSPHARRHEVMTNMTMKEHMHIKRALHGGHHGDAGPHGNAPQHGKAGRHGAGGQHGAGEHKGHGSAGAMNHHGSEEGAHHRQGQGGEGN